MRRNELIKLLKDDGVRLENVDTLSIAQLERIYEAHQKQKEVLPKGKFQLSFDVKLNFKNRGATEEFHVSKTIDTNGRETITRIIEKTIADFISENFHASESDVVETSNVDIRKYNAQELLKLRMKRQLLQYKLLAEDVIVNASRKDECVLNFMLAEVCKVWSRYTRKKLLEELGEEGLINGWSIEDIMKWAEHKGCVSAYALDPFDKVISSVVAEERTSLRLVFKINNDHCYPIMQQELKDIVSRTKRLELKRQVFEYGSSLPYVVVQTLDEAKAYEGPASLVYVDGVHDLSDLAHRITRESGILLEKGQYRESLLEKMIHPVNDKIIVAANAYHERKHVADTELAKSDYVAFRWCNQSWLSLASTIMDLKVGAIPKSDYGPDIIDILSNYKLGPWVVQTGNVVEPGEVVESFDYCKQYTCLLLENVDPFSVFSKHDDVKEWNPDVGFPAGEYCLRNDILIADDTIRITQWQPSVIIKHLLAEGYITTDDIVYYIRASNTLKPDLFKPFVEYLIETYPQSYKHLVNHFVGGLNRQSQTTMDVAMTTSFDLAIATQMADNDVKITKVRDIWFLRKTTTDPLTEGHSPIWRHIQACSLIKLDIMQKKVCDSNTKVISYNTDSITVVGPRKDFAPVMKELAKPGDICREKPKYLKGTLMDNLEWNPDYIWDPKPWRKITKEELMSSRCSAMVIGKAGSRKSTCLKALHHADAANGEKPTVFAFTNCAVDNIQIDEPRASLKGVPVGSAHTLDSFFHKELSLKARKQKLRGFTSVQLDEGGMIPKHFYGLLYDAHREYPFTIRSFQDQNQCHAVEEDNNWMDNLNCKYMRMLFGQNLCELECHNGRYDQELSDELQYTIDNGNLTTNWENHRLFSFDETDFNICMTNRMVQKTNKSYLEHHRVGKETITVGGLTLWVGMPIVCNTNLPKLKLYNSQRYYISEINADHLKLQRDEETRILPLSEVKSTSFDYGYTMTVYRVQGRTIRTPYNVLETNLMYRNHFYTAVSRAITKSHIGLVYTTRTFPWQSPAAPKLLDVEPITLKKGYIYRLSDDNFEYIGQTVNPELREQQHYEHATSEKMKEWLCEKKKFEVIDSFMYYLDEQMNKIERGYISKMDALKSKNTQCVVEKAKESEKVRVDVKIVNDRFRIVDDEKNCWFAIQYKEEGVKKLKKFRYKTDNKAVKLAEAEQCQKELIKQHC